MRKVKLIVIYALICLEANAQVFFEDFNNGIPSTFKTYDEDGLTPNQSMAGLGFSPGKGWISYSLNDGQSSFATSTSKYSQTGTSDDWLVTPRISIPSEGYFLEWKAISCSKSSCPGYKILISTSGATVNDFSEESIFETEQEESKWVSRHISLDKYSGKNIHIAFVNNSTDKYLLGIDDIRVSVPNRITSLTSATPANVGGVAEFPVSGAIRANYSQPITSFTASYTCGGNTATQEFGNLTINPEEDYTFEFDKKLATSPGDTVSYTIAVKIKEETHLTEGNTTCFKFIPKRSHIIEEATGTWCGFCPSGHVAMEYMHETYPDDFIGIAVHNEDPMTVKLYDSGIYSLGIGGYPTGFINRKYKSSPLGADLTPGNGGFETWYLKAREEIAPAELSFTAEYSNSEQTEIQFHANAKFALNLPSANYTIAFVIKECNVKGTSPKYGQTNYYAGSEKAIGGFEKLPRVIPASVMVYHDVARSVKPSFKGELFVNKSITTDEEVSLDYTTPMPESITDENNISFIALLLDVRTGEIVNARSFNFSSHEHEGLATSIQRTANESMPSVSVQTVNGMSTITIQTPGPAKIIAGLYSMDGTCLSSQKILSVQDEHQLVFPSHGVKGVYLLKLNLDGKNIVRKILF